MRKRASQLVFQRLLEAAFLFGSAGTWRWLGAWLYLGTATLLIAANAVYVYPRNPEIIVERGKSHEGTRGWDWVVLLFYTGFLIAMLVVAGLDAGRYHWSPLAPAWAALGVVAMALSMIPVAGAMAVNRHLEQTVRIQSDREHGVVTTGPYAWVRHPMYMGMVASILGSVLVLGSAWAFVPAVLAIAALVVRTALEDRTLRRDLKGYEEYTKKTRYRLIPGVW